MTRTIADSSKSAPTPVGGGLKKVLYTLRTAREAGLRSTAKALTANNTCKACGLGMGGQQGGMTNELGEFPSVCNKSVQAQSTDLQPPIPLAVFDHALADLRELDEREFAHLGRLDTPLFKAAGADRYRGVSWDEAMTIAASRFAAVAPESTFFYSSGRSSNEAGFVLQLFARLYGTNNVNNCSYYCHQATSEALGSTIGTGTATVELADLADCDLVFLFGANPASNHPRFIYQLKGCRDRGGEVIVVNPAREPGLVRFAMPKSARSLIAGGSEIATEYLQPRIGSDIALLKGLGKAVLEAGLEDEDFIGRHTTGFESYRDDVTATPWSAIVSACGIEEQEIRRIALKYGRADRAVFAWGMGLTHHTHGVHNVEQVANLAMLRGMIGKRAAGLLPLRGHSNVQGIGTIGVKPVLPAEVMSRMEQALGLSLPRGPGLDTMAAMQAAAAGRIRAALLMGGNLYSANPDSTWAEAALGAIPFKMFLTTTLNRSHVYGVAAGESLLLPVTARDEEPESTTQESMFNFVRLSDGGIVRLENVRSESRILCDLAERVLGRDRFDFSVFRKHRSVREAIAASVPGMEALATIDVARREFHVGGRLLHTPEFKTRDGRCHFSVCAIPSVSSEAPFMLATVRSEGQFNTLVYEDEDSYRGVPHRWSVLMSPADMARLGLARGDRVTVRSEHGVMEGVSAFPFDVPTGNVLAYFPEANVLTGTTVDPRSRTPAFKSTPVRIVTAAHAPARPRPAGRRERNRITPSV